MIYNGNSLELRNTANCHSYVMPEANPPLAEKKE